MFMTLETRVKVELVMLVPEGWTQVNLLGVHPRRVFSGRDRSDIGQ